MISLFYFPSNDWWGGKRVLADYGVNWNYIHVQY